MGRQEGGEESFMEQHGEHGEGHHGGRHYREFMGMGGSGRMGMMRHMGMMGPGMGMGAGMMERMAGMTRVAPWRHFVSREEIAARLEEYLKQLQAEEKAVSERIEELKKKGESGQT